MWTSIPDTIRSKFSDMNVYFRDTVATTPA